MAKTTTNTKEQTKGTQRKKTRDSARAEKKQKQKEQAKQEAKLMLKVEQAKKDVQKAEQKLAKGQSQLEEARTHQHTLEEKLTKLRTPQQEESHNGVSVASDGPLAVLAQPEDTSVTPLSLETPFIKQSIDTSSVNAPTTTEQSTEETQPPQLQITSDTSDAQIESDGGSMPIVSQDENAWPPPAIREEVAEATTSAPHVADSREEKDASNSSEDEETPSTGQTNTSQGFYHE